MASLTASVSHMICILERSLWCETYFLTFSSIRWLISEKGLRVSTQHLLPESLFLILPMLKFSYKQEVNIEVLHKWTVQSRALAVLMLACSGIYIQYIGNNAGEIPIVVADRF